MKESILIKVFLIITLSFILCACGSKNINSGQESQYSNFKTPSETVSVEDSKKEYRQPELNSTVHRDVHNLNNRATFFEEFLYIKSMETSLVFSDKDENGNYYSWQFPEELLPETTNTYRHFKYKNQLVFISHIADGNSEIILFDSEFKIVKKKKIESFTASFLYGNILYGYSNNEEFSTIKTINLDSLEEMIIYSSKHEMHSSFIISNSGEVIICERPDITNTCFYKCSEGVLTPILEIRDGVLVFCDSRGLFYLEENIDKENWNLMLLNGSNSQMIGEIKTDDLFNWEFYDGTGNIRIEDEFYVTIHTYTDEPYLLIHPFDSEETIRIAIKNWPFTEADMSRFGETFSGIYYEDGVIVDYFFSNKAGMLQTKTIDLKEIYNKEMAAIEERE